MNNRTKKVIEGFTHKYYKHTVDLAKFYRQIATGEDYGDLIVNYKPRESNLQKEQRVRITQNRTKSIAGKIEGFFKRTFRVDKLAFEVTHKDESKKTEISTHIDKYGNDGQTLLTWCEEAALFFNNIDPNAFCWVKHQIENGVESFSPFVFKCDEVKDYDLDKGLVDWCVTQLSERVEWQTKNKTEGKALDIFYYFNSDGLEMSIELNTDVQKNTDFYEAFIDDNGDFIGTTEKVKNKTYLVVFQPSDTKKVPVTRMGYFHDKETNKKTYVSFWDNATFEYKQLVNRGSEYDLSLTLHAFLQKIQYYTPCDYQDTASHSICRGGTLHPNKETCPSCSGTGKQVHTSSQDVIEVQLPNQDGEKIVISPKDFVFYVDVPFDIVKQQKEDVAEFAPKIAESIFGVDISHQQSGMATATQITNYYDTAQDAMFEFTKAPRRLFLFTIDTIADSLGIDGLERQLIYTNEYDLESEDYLLTLLDKAKKAGASPEVIENINKRLVIKQNRTDSAYMSVYTTMRKFLPFSSVEPELKQSIILALPDSDIQKALYLNFKEITEDIVSNDLTFLMMDYNNQKKLVESKAQLFADKAVASNSVRAIGSFSTDNLTNNSAN